MSKAQIAARAYSRHGGQVKDLRSQEYDVILTVTRDLKKLQNGKNARFNEIVATVHKNERLWTTIGAQVADSNNELPQELRASLFYISKYVTTQTNQILKKQGDIGVLVDVNVSVLRGLKGIV